MLYFHLVEYSLTTVYQPLLENRLLPEDQMSHVKYSAKYNVFWGFTIIIHSTKVYNICMI